MNLVHNTIHFSPSTFSRRRHPHSSSIRRRLTPVRASLPFPTQKAKYHKELEAAVGIVERACRICVDVQKSLLSIDGGIVEKKDNSPVTVADFGVQGLISYVLLMTRQVQTNLCLMMLFLRRLTEVGVLLVYLERSQLHIGCWIQSMAPKGSSKGVEHYMWWGLALVVEGEIVAGIMGCPNWQNSESSGDLGAVMIAHTGCGTWTKMLGDTNDWSRCSVDGFSLVSKSRFCIPESQSWKSLPLSGSFDTTYDADGIGNHEVHLMTTCCGRQGFGLHSSTERANSQVVGSCCWRYMRS